MDLRNAQNPRERRNLIEKELDIAIPTIGDVFKDESPHVHCENLIGAVTIPLGVAGPVTIKGNHLKGDHLIPLATSEGALVASVARGCKVISESGGTTVRQENMGTTRGPVFSVNNIEQGLWFKQWIDGHFSELAAIAKNTSSHLNLKKISTRLLGRKAYVRFSYDTEDAMGMNMVTIATDSIATYIKEKTGIRCLALAGNFDIDKKPAWLNMISGRGRRGWAEVVVSSGIVLDVLKTTPQRITDVVIHKCWGGSMMSGALGFNAHFANIVAAFFAATGQDLAHVVEGSLGVTSAEVLESGDLYFSIYMPDIMIGTVGGGTKLKTQTEARTITKVKTADELTEVLLAAVLAGELSLIASIAASSLAAAHQKLGR